MNKTTIIVLAVATAVVIAGWAFFTYGGTKRQPLTDAQQKVLNVQDERLSKGDKNAPIKIVEYADILCPYCAKANSEIIPQIQSHYIDKNQAHYEVRLVAMIAEDSERASEGAYCAAEQDMFWRYLDKAYKDTWDTYYSQGATPQDVDLFNKDKIYRFGKTVGLEMLQWQQCMDDGAYKETIALNRKEMIEIKAYGTPHFNINGKNYNGAPPFQSFKAVIDAELNQAKAGS